MELALEHNKRNLQAIYPILVGETKGGVWSKFDSSVFRLNDIPTHPSATSERGIKNTLSALFKFQGKWMTGPLFTDEEINEIVEWCHEYAWDATSKSQGALKVCDILYLCVHL